MSDPYNYGDKNRKGHMGQATENTERTQQVEQNKLRTGSAEVGFSVAGERPQLIEELTDTMKLLSRTEADIVIKLAREMRKDRGWLVSMWDRWSGSKPPQSNIESILTKHPVASIENMLGELDDDGIRRLINAAREILEKRNS